MNIPYVFFSHVKNSTTTLCSQRAPITAAILKTDYAQDIWWKTETFYQEEVKISRSLYNLVKVNKKQICPRPRHEHRQWKQSSTYS
jgi:hypothetical protein